MRFTQLLLVTTPTGRPELSKELLLDAEETGSLSSRSTSEQLEFWARLRQAQDPPFHGDHAPASRRGGDHRALSELMQSVDSEAGRQRVRHYLARQPFPHYESASKPGLHIRTEADGTSTKSRFVNRRFQAVD